MGKRQFKESERYAIFVVHGEKCYMCTEPIDLMSMQVDHVIPESLERDAEKLLSVLANYGLPPSFDLQSFENLLPSCGHCNNRKKDSVFNVTLRIQLELERARAKAPRVADLEARVDNGRYLSKAWSSIKCAAQSDSLPIEIRKDIAAFQAFHRENRVPENVSEPIRVSPTVEILEDRGPVIRILQEHGGIRFVRGPYGIGGGPVDDTSIAARCGVCGGKFFNGPRCITCGNMEGCD